MTNRIKKFMNPETVDIPPNGEATFRMECPPGMVPNGMEICFDCSECGHRHSASLPMSGGEIKGTCECGSEYHLEVGAAERGK